MSDQSVIISSASFIVMAGLAKKQKNQRKYWMTSLYNSRTRYRGSDLLNDLKRGYIGQFQNFCRISANDFEILLNKIGPKISKQDTTFRPSIPIQERLAITLRFLATGDSYTSLMYLFKVSKQLISTIVPEVCAAIIEALQEMIQLPNTMGKWLNVAERFEEQWDFPHCIGTIDGKHCIVQCPISSGSEFYNYKSSFSIVLMGVADADYCFLYANVGCQGKISDGGVFKNTSFYKNMQKNKMNISNERPLPGRTIEVPYVFVADDAFSLMTNIMKPYPGIQKKGSKERTFNYRLSRACRVIENTFGIMLAVFRVLRKPMLIEPEKASIVVLCCIYLHNFLRKSHDSRNIYTPPGTFDTEIQGNMTEGTWRNDNNLSSFLPLPRIGRKPSQAIREEFAHYFTTNMGSVPWQDYCS